MSICHEYREYLKNNKVSFVTYYHDYIRNPLELSKKLHIPLNSLVKTAILKTDSGYEMLLVPKCYDIKLDMIKKALNKDNIKILTKKELKKVFPKSEYGTVPPFGVLYNMPIYVESSLDFYNNIVFNVDSYNDSMKINYGDFKRLEKPKMVHAFAALLS
ncbi:MAG: hypothetical protein GTO02_17385 [Candidatus Dadabacteria bacterium]|nr:hypothetical protein [Candidatus Dadabacteria bacterium]